MKDDMIRNPQSGSSSTARVLPALIAGLALYVLALASTPGLRAQSNCLTVTCSPGKIVNCGDTNWTFDPPTVRDDCCDSFSIVPLGVVSNGSCPLYLTKTWYIFDTCGNSNLCSQTVTTINTNPPVFQGASNITVAAGSCSNVPVDYNVTATESCCGALGVVCTPPSGSSFGLGRTPVVYVATDCCGRAVSNVFFVTIVNTNQPVFQGVSTITLSSCGPTQVFYNPTAYEACCGPLNVHCSPPSGSTFNAGQATPVSCVVTDCFGQVFSTSFYVNVIGGAGVQLSGTNKSVVCGTDWTYDEPTIYDPCCPYTNYNISYVGPFTNGIGPCAQTNSIIWVVSDQCGNSNSFTQFVTILNTVVPYPTNQFIACDAPVPTNPPTYFSGCCSNVVFSLEESYTNNLGCNEVISQVWQAFDCCSNIISATNTVTILPASPTIVCASNKVIAGTGCTLPSGAATFGLLYSFPQTDTDGSNPRAGLLLASDQVLYGTTYAGGGGYGTVFKMNQDGTGYQVVYSFDGAGANPTAGVIEGSDGALYGTTYYGGYGYGNVFKLNKDGTGFQDLHDFNSGNPSPDGEYPQAGLLLAGNGTLYGTTTGGGQYGEGTVFSLDTNGTYSVLYNFGSFSGDGLNPWAALVVGPDGALYGTTRNGGLDGFGTIFKLNLDGSGYVDVFNFGLIGGDGVFPEASLVVGAGGVMFGTTYGGGANGVGSVFSIQTNGTYSILYSFGNFTGDGGYPYAGLMVGCDQGLYGTTSAGGDNNLGAVFTLNQDGSGYAIMKSFASGDGSTPYGGLAQGTNGQLYGTTEAAGSNGEGTVYQVPLALNDVFDPPTLVGGCCTNVTVTAVSTVSQSTPCGQSLTRTWVITDCCGQSNVCSQTVTVGGSLGGPVLNSSNLTVTCGSPIPTNPPSVYDPGCSNVIVTLIGATTNTVGCGQLISQVWQAIDCCSNTTVCTQLVTVVASLPPSCSPLFTHSGSQDPATEGQGWWIVNDGQGVLAGTSGTGIDDNGTPAWQVVDNSSTSYLIYEGRLTTAQAMQASDYGWELSTTVKLPNPGQPTDDTDIAYYDGMYEWEMAFGTTPAGDPYVVLADTGAGETASGPTYTVVGGSNSYVNYTLKYDPITRTANLYVNGTLQIPNFPTPFSNNIAYFPSVRWGAGSGPNEGVGNFAAVSFCLGTPPGPDITCASNKTVQCGTSWSFDPPTLTGGCCTNLVYSLVSSNLVSSSGCQQVYQGLWQVTDCCSNNFLCAQQVTVVASPDIFQCPSNILITSCTNIPVLFPAITVSNSCCTNVNVLYVPPSGTLFAPGSTNPVQCLITDCCGQTNSCSFTVTVNPCQVVTPCGTNLRAKLIGDTVIVTWDGGGVLQSTTNLLHPNWVNVPGNPDGSYATTASDPAAFYRVVCPPVAQGQTMR